MAVKPGYRQTDIGVIPDDWDILTIRDVSHMVTVGFVGSMSHLFVSSGVPLLRGQDVLPRRIDLTDSKFISAKTHSLWKKSALRGGDLVIVRVGYPGTCAVVPEGFGEANAASLIVVRPDTSLVESNFMCWTLLSNIGRKQINAALVGGAQQVINIGTAGSLRIPVPSRYEQSAITTVLSDVDALLEALERLVAKKRDLKHAAMQQLLTGQIRLPGFEGEWKVTTLLELAGGKKELFDDGDWIESEHITSQGVRLVQTGNIGVGCFVEKEDRKYIYEASFTSLRCKQLRTGDLLVCRLAEPAGRACVFPDIGEEKVVTSVDVTICRPPSEVASRTYLANLFSTPEWFRTVSDRSGGTTHKRISRGALGRIEFELPPLPEQTAIAAVLSDMDAELVALEQRLAKTRTLKQA